MVRSQPRNPRTGQFVKEGKDAVLKTAIVMAQRRMSLDDYSTIRRNFCSNEGRKLQKKAGKPYVLHECKKTGLMPKLK